MKQDTIERTITVDCPIDRAWAALTVAEHLASWFGDAASVELAVGGEMTIGWSEYDTVVRCVVEHVEEPTAFAFRWEAGADADGRIWSTRVAFTLDEQAGRTTITVVESGLSELPDELYDRTLEENSSGWRSEMTDLAAFLTMATA